MAARRTVPAGADVVVERRQGPHALPDDSVRALHRRAAGLAVEAALPQLEEAEKSCQAAKTADEVRAVLDRARVRLRGLLDAPAAAAPGVPIPPPSISSWRARLWFGAEGWFRILYWLQTQATTFGVGRFNLKTGKSAVRAQQFRVPLGLLPARAVPLWARFLALHVDPQVPVLLVWAADQDWMDVTLGEPTSHEFFCLRAGRGRFHWPPKSRTTTTGGSA